MNVLGSCMKTFNLIPLARHESGNIISACKTSRVFDTRVTLYERPWALVKMHADAARRDLGVAGYYRCISGEEWKGASGMRNNTRSASRTYLASVFSGMICIWSLSQWDVINVLPKQASDCRSAERRREREIPTCAGYSGCNRLRLIIGCANAFGNTRATHFSEIRLFPFVTNV